jgi:hypothetical protein
MLSQEISLVWRCMLVIPAMLEAYVGVSQSKDNLGKMPETLSEK